jgi:hypothetical protein
MKSAARRESQNRVTEAARRLKGLLKLEHVSTNDVSYYRSNLILLGKEIETAKICGDTGPYINRLLDQLQPVREQLFQAEMALVNQEKGKINHRIELTRAFREFSEALESTGLVMVSNLGDRLAFTFSGFLKYCWLRFIDKEIQARYIASRDYDFESLAQLFLTAKAKIEEGV